jgi:hypothetical protein
MVADHHAAAGRRRLLLTLKGGGRAIPPVSGHVFPWFLVLVLVVGQQGVLQQNYARIHPEYPQFYNPASLHCY